MWVDNHLHSVEFIVINFEKRQTSFLYMMSLLFNIICPPINKLLHYVKKVFYVWTASHEFTANLWLQMLHEFVSLMAPVSQLFWFMLNKCTLIPLTCNCKMIFVWSLTSHTAIRCLDYRRRFPNIETNETFKFSSFACFLLFDRFTVWHLILVGILNCANYNNCHTWKRTYIFQNILSLISFGKPSH